MLRHVLHVSRRKWWFAGALGGVFGVTDFLAQIAAVEPVSIDNVVWWRACAAPIGAFALSWLLFSVLDYLGRSKIGSGEIGARTRGDRWLVPASFALPLVAWAAQFLRYWPMASMNDTWWILGEPIAYARYHPLAYTYSLSTLARVGGSVFGSPAAGLAFAAVIQMVLWAGVVAVLIRYLKGQGARPVALWMLIAYVALFPMIGNYSFALVKDAVFSMFVVLLIPVIGYLRASKGTALRSVWFFAASIIVLVGFSIFRNNGLMAMLILLPLLVAYSSRARVRSISLAILVALVSFVPLTLTAKLAGPQQFQESVGVPLQILGYAHVNAPECLPRESLSYFNGVLNQRTWVELYTPGDVDTVKFSGRIDLAHLGETREEFVANFLAAAAACPGEFVAGYLSHTNHLWRIDSANAGQTGGQSYFTGIISNQPEKFGVLLEAYSSQGIVNRSQLPEWISEPFGSVLEWGLRAVPGPGTWLWLTLITIAGFAYRKRGEWLAIFAPTLVIWATLLAAAPAVHPFRYVAFILLVLPVSWVILFATPPIRKQAIDRHPELMSQDRQLQ